MKNNTLPILLKDQKILLIGGGNVALQKAQVLRENNINFRIIAETLSKKITKLSEKVEQKCFKLKDINDENIIESQNSKIW